MTRIPDPATQEEYDAKFNRGSQASGYGLDVTQHVACPFCAEPGWAEWQPAAGILPDDDRPNMDAQMAAEHTCANCGRSAKCIVTHDGDGITMEFVQTGGDDPPPYLPPIRRVDADE